MPARKRELRTLLLSEKFKEAEMISHISQSASDWLVELSLVTAMGLPPKAFLPVAPRPDVRLLPKADIRPRN
jgi:hypothetical protein